MTELRYQQRGALLLLDDAVGLLRQGGPSDLLLWTVGTAPLVVAATVWITDLRGPFAGERNLLQAGLVALTYCLMKAWHAMFAERLAARAVHREPPRVDGARLVRHLARQTRWQPWAWIALPLAALATIPFARTYAFFHGLSVVGEPGRAWREAGVAPKQNHLLIAVLALASLVVVFDVLIAVAITPQLLRLLLGWHTDLAANPLTLLSSTTLVAVIGLAYLALGPVVKAAYVLRAVEAAAASSGEDILASLRALEEGA